MLTKTFHGLKELTVFGSTEQDSCMKPFSNWLSSSQTGVNKTEQHEFAKLLLNLFNFVRLCYLFLGRCCDRTSEKCEKKKPWGGCSIYCIWKAWHHLVVVLYLSSLFPCTSICTWWFSMHSNIQFSDKSKHVAQLSLIKDAAYISIIHALHLSVDHKRFSQQLQLWCFRSESFGDGCAIHWDRWDETQRTGSSQARGIFQCSPAH